ncbi:MAG: nucleoside-diphosphate kinase [Acidobacteriota bacterium]
MATTLTIIKPDAVAAGNAGNILALLEEKGFKIRALRMLRLTTDQAKAFYEVHKERPFYGELVEFMTSGPVIPAALEHDNAVPYLREVMGATNSAEAAEGTVRALYGTNIERNAIHGSDSPENAAIELAFFFSRADRIAAS